MAMDLADHEGWILNRKAEGLRLTAIYPAEATPTCPEVPPSTSRGRGEGESKTRGLLASLLKKKLACCLAR